MSTLLHPIPLPVLILNSVFTAMSNLIESCSRHEHVPDKNQQISNAPIIDLSLLSQDSNSRALVIQQIAKACQRFGFFTAINHGICESLLEDVIDVNLKFFEVPMEDKKGLMSDDVHRPVRFGTVEEENGDLNSTREFLKFYAYPLEDWIGSWPHVPLDFREKMGRYSTEVRRLGIQVFEVIMERLNMRVTRWKPKIEQGVQMIGVNLYQPLHESNILKGIPPHTDHSIVTVLLQGSPGLEVMDLVDRCWKCVAKPKCSLQVLVGNHLEVLSNGLCKSVLHKAMPGSMERRFSVVSLLSFAMDEIVEPAIELVDEGNPKRYRGSSLRDFLDHLSSKQSIPFGETLTLEP